jgi:hypothetical protein
MTSPQEPIPTLPPMRRPPRRRRRSYAPYVVGGVVVAVIALGLMGLAIQARFRRLADESFLQAEQFFDSGAFNKARLEYERFCDERPKDPRVPQAQMVAELSKVAQSLDDPGADPAKAIASLDRFASDSHGKPTFKERWPIILTVTQRSTRSLFERAQRSLTAADVEAADVWLKWLHDQQRFGAEGSESLSLNELDELSTKGHTAVAAEGRRRAFLDAADRAIADGETASFAQAFRAFERWQAEARGPDAPIQAKFEQLKGALRAGIKFTPPPASGETAPPLPKLALDSYTLLATRTQHLTANRPGSRAVFARVKDLCYALEPSTGAARWVARVGYDAPVPETATHAGKPAAVVTWYDGDDALITLCDAATGETIWSWKSPDPIHGPPAVTRDAIYAATHEGSLWLLDLELGAARGVANLPEAIDSPPTLREDGRGVCVVGASQAVYLFDTAREVPECSEVVLMNRRPDTAECRVLWVPPYVVVFENDLMARCFVRVLFQEAAGYRQLRQIELDGRVWQTPVIDGADIFVVTDRWKSYCFGLDPGNSAVNLYTAATQVKAPPEMVQPSRPHAARVSELPFACLTDAVRGYRADRAQGLIREVWSRPLPHAGTRGVQPLQAMERLIVATLQEPESDGVLMQAFNAGQGELVWETRLAANARELTPLRGSESANQLLTRTDSGHVFLITRDTQLGKSESRMLGIPAPTAAVHQSATTGELVYGCDGGAAIQVVSTKDWARVGDSIRTPPMASESTLYEGELRMQAGETTQRLRGRWVLYLTADRTLVIRSLDPKSDEIHGVRLPAVVPNEEPWTWAPTVCDDSGIIVGHPRGIVYRSEIQSSEGIVHLALAEQRTDVPPLLMAPIAMTDGLLCIGRDGRCVALDPKTLRTQAEWRAPAAIRDAVVATDRVWLCLEDSSVLSLRFDSRKLKSGWQTPLPGHGWSLADADTGRLLAVQPEGFLIVLNKDTGERSEPLALPAPPAQPPRLVGGEWVLATVDGGITFIPVGAMP